MLLTITTTHQPATDLGHLLRKHPLVDKHIMEQRRVRTESFADTLAGDQLQGKLL